MKLHTAIQTSDSANKYDELENTSQRLQAMPHSEYRIASISKVVTAMGIAKLVSKKLLSLDSLVFGERGSTFPF